MILGVGYGLYVILTPRSASDDLIGIASIVGGVAVTGLLYVGRILG